MALKDRILVISSLIILIISFPIGPFDQAQANDTPAARASSLQELLDSVEGVAEEPPRIFKTKDGYLRFLGSPPSTDFTVDPNKRATPQEAAEAFLAQNLNLFVNDSTHVGFETVRVKSRNGRTYVRYQQTYAGLEVFGAEMIVQVNVAGGIAAVISDIMRDSEALGMGKVSLNPTIDPLTAQGKAIEFLAAQHSQIEFEATPATLMGKIKGLRIQTPILPPRFVSSEICGLSEDIVRTQNQSIDFSLAIGNLLPGQSVTRAPGVLP